MSALDRFRIRAPADARHALASAALLRGLDAEVIDEVAASVVWMLLPSGRQLVRPGDPADSVFIVASGRLHVTLEDGRGGERFVREIDRGESLGELRVLADEPWSATVCAVLDTVLARLPRERFNRLVEQNPRILTQLTRSLAARRRSWGGERLPGMLRTIAVVPLSPDAPIAAFAAKLVFALAPHGSVLRLGADDINARFGAGAAEADGEDPRSYKIARWLNEQEAAGRLVVLQTAGETSGWARRCIRHADRVLAVARADADPRHSRTAPVFRDVAAERGDVMLDLALVHEADYPTSRSAQVWLSHHRFAAHYHVRMSAGQDFARLARHLLGRSVGLVLGGGGARAYAHIGVIRALEEAGVPIDRIGGTSIGALIAAQYALGYGGDALVELNRRGWFERHPLVDYTLPLVALLSGRASRRALDRCFGDARIEDMRLPFFCVSANLTKAELVVHRDGPVAKWVRASFSVPGVLPPVVSECGDLLVDGAVLNNVSVNVMRAAAPGPVIAVDVTPPTDLGPGRGYADDAGPAQLLRACLRRSRSEGGFPSILQILVGSTLLSSNSLVKRTCGEADLCLRPPVGQYDLFAWKALEQIVDAGYTYAARAIRQWNAAIPAGVAARLGGRVSGSAPLDSSAAVSW